MRGPGHRFHTLLPMGEGDPRRGEDVILVT